MAMIVKSVFHDKIREMLIGKYGKPALTKNDTTQNQAGATFDDVITAWQFREGMLILRKRFARVDTSYLSFENSAVNAQINVQDAQKQQAAGKKAF